MKQSHFLVNTNNFFQTHFEATEIPTIEQNQVLFRIQKFAFTSNNITYAVVGERMKYWEFFPADDNMGRVPVWGYAVVDESQHPDIRVGERFFGYFPMSKYLVVTADRVTPAGFADQAPHRQALSPIYNFYSNINADSGLIKAYEDYFPIIRPLFATSFLNYYFLKEEGFFQAKQAILTSASSKTGLALAYMLKANQAEDQLQIIGLTSPGNVDFVKETGFYDQVVAYDQVEENLPKEASLIVDFAGNGPLLTDIYGLLGDKLHYVSKIGLTDWKGEIQSFQHPNSKMFFAPTFAQKLFQQLGMQEANHRINTTMGDFLSIASKWLEIFYIDKQAAVSALFNDMLSGHVNPRRGYIVRPHYW